MTSRRVGMLCLSVVSIVATRAAGQSAEDLYQAGAFRLAADSFALRASAEPDIAAHWYNLGSAFYRAGDDAAARAAWVQAARLSPRNGEVRQALLLVPAPDAASASASEASIVTPGEVLVLGAILWLVAWGLFAFRRSRRLTVSLLIAGVTAMALSLGKVHEYRQPVALVRHAGTALRAAPFASAQTRRAMGEGTTVEVLRRYAGWVLVQRGNDRGWVQAAELVVLGGGT